MRTCHDVMPQLSLLVDGLLSAEERKDVRAHLARCAACRGVLADLERLKAAAGELGPIAPPPHIWLEVAGQTHHPNAHAANGAPSSARARVRWQWAGLAAALILVTVGLYLFQRVNLQDSPASASASNAPAAGTVEAVTEELSMAATHYENAIAALETMAGDPGGAIGADVATALRADLNASDQAIAESRAALSSNPDSEPARTSLFEALRRKIAVLQDTVSLINEMQRGDEDAAARAVDSLGKKS